MSDAAVGAAARPGAPIALWRQPAFRWTLALAALLALAMPLWWAPLASALTDLEFAVARVFPEARIRDAAWFLLPVFGLVTGVLASVSPCVLPLVPLNVAYIGAADASGWKAAALSGRFVLGARPPPESSGRATRDRGSAV